MTDFVTIKTVRKKIYYHYILCRYNSCDDLFATALLWCQEEGLNASQAKAAVSEMDQAIKGREEVAPAPAGI